MQCPVLLLQLLFWSVFHRRASCAQDIPLILEDLVKGDKPAGTGEVEAIDSNLVTLPARIESTDSAKHGLLINFTSCVAHSLEVIRAVGVAREFVEAALYRSQFSAKDPYTYFFRQHSVDIVERVYATMDNVLHNRNSAKGIAVVIMCNQPSEPGITGEGGRSCDPIGVDNDGPWTYASPMREGSSSREFTLCWNAFRDLPLNPDRCDLPRDPRYIDSVGHWPAENVKWLRDETSLGEVIVIELAKFFTSQRHSSDRLRGARSRFLYDPWAMHTVAYADRIGKMIDSGQVALSRHSIFPGKGVTDTDIPMNWVYTAKEAWRQRQQQLNKLDSLRKWECSSRARKLGTEELRRMNGDELRRQVRLKRLLQLGVRDSP